MIGFIKNLFKPKTSKGYFFGAPGQTPINMSLLRSPNHEDAVEAQHSKKRVLAENEILVFSDTNKFKVGDGKSFIENLPYSDTLPETFVVYVDAVEFFKNAALYLNLNGNK